MTLDEWQGINPKDIPNWPYHAQLLALASLLIGFIGLGYFFILSAEVSKLDAAEQQEAQLKEIFIDKKRQAANLLALQKQLKEIDDSFGALLKQLPTKSNMDALLSEINQAGVGRGLQFELFKPNSEIKHTEMAETPITIRLTGSYNELAAFVSDVAQLSRIVTITGVNLSPNNTKDKRMTLDATAKTFRSLELEERAAQSLLLKK